jgi:hypothetical protein
MAGMASATQQSTVFQIATDAPCKRKRQARPKMRLPE